MWILDYFEEEKKRRSVEGYEYTLKAMAEELGCSATYISVLVHGKRIITAKMADQFSERTNGKIDADLLIEKSIERHKKYLDRKKKFGDLVH
jgi:plasmid maintenance system antidote protein VapI